jgi:hypothetical protein
MPVINNNNKKKKCDSVGGRCEMKANEAAFRSATSLVDPADKSIHDLNSVRLL